MNDISIEINGRRVAVAQAYRARSNKYGNAYSHIVELSRVCSTNENILGLSGFNIVIVKLDRRIVFSGCEIESVDEQNGNTCELLCATSSKRFEFA